MNKIIQIGIQTLIEFKKKAFDFLEVDPNKAIITLLNKQIHYLFRGKTKTKFWTRLDFFFLFLKKNEVVRDNKNIHNNKKSRKLLLRWFLVDQLGSQTLNPVYL